MDSLYRSTPYGCVTRYVCKFDRSNRFSNDIRLSVPVVQCVRLSQFALIRSSITEDITEEENGWEVKSKVETM